MKYQIAKDRIIETPTNQIVMKSSCRKSLQKTFRKLIQGSGFDGETPAFFCIGVSS